MLARLGVVARAEARDAFVHLAQERAYLTKEMRFTGGLRFVFSANVVLKAEYLHNREYGGIQRVHERRVHELAGAGLLKRREPKT